MKLVLIPIKRHIFSTLVDINLTVLKKITLVSTQVCVSSKYNVYSNKKCSLYLNFEKITSEKFTYKISIIKNQNL